MDEGHLKKIKMNDTSHMSPKKEPKKAYLKDGLVIKLLSETCKGGLIFVLFCSIPMG